MLEKAKKSKMVRSHPLQHSFGCILIHNSMEIIVDLHYLIGNG